MKNLVLSNVLGTVVSPTSINVPRVCGEVLRTVRVNSLPLALALLSNNIGDLVSVSCWVWCPILRSVVSALTKRVKPHPARCVCSSEWAEVSLLRTSRQCPSTGDRSCNLLNKVKLTVLTIVLVLLRTGRCTIISGLPGALRTLSRTGCLACIILCNKSLGTMSL